MRRLSAALCCLAALALIAWTPPKPRVSRLAVASVASDSTVAMLATITMKFPLKAGDKLRVKWFQNNTLMDSTDTTGTSLRSPDLPARCGTVGQMWALVRIVYANGSMGPQVQSNTLSYTQAACPVPPGEIDNVKVEPADVTLPPGGTQTFRVVPGSVTLTPGASQAFTVTES